MSIPCLVAKYLAIESGPGHWSFSVGCGPASFVAAVTIGSSISGNGHRRSARPLAASEGRKIAEFARANLFAAMRSRWVFHSNSFDLVYCRMLLLLQYLKGKERGMV